MEPGIYRSRSSKIRSNRNQDQKEENLSIIQAVYLTNYKILIWFSNGKQRIFNFESLLLKYAQGAYSKWILPANFKKFIVKNGNIYWGVDEDIIFPVSFLYTSRLGTTQKDEILYVIKGKLQEKA